MTLREKFEHYYITHAFDLEANPIGSRDCATMWEGFKAGAASRGVEVLSLTNQRDYEYVRAENAEHDRLLVKIAAKDAEVEELVAALRLWKLASNNSEESELDDMACYCVPMPLFCDADEATEAVLDKAGRL